MPLAAGIYDQLIDEEVRALLDRNPEVRSVIGKLEADEEPERFAWFVSRLLEKALRQQTDSTARLRLCNALIQQISDAPGLDFLGEKKLNEPDGRVLMEV